jgi:two-component system, chemotaxis family, protein-glutamate methylesterase/glutaminase
MNGNRVVVIGASAGGVQALCNVVECLPTDLPAALLIVLHTAPHSRSALPAILARSGCLPASHPADGELIEPGRIYIAPPDRHLAVRNGRIHLSRNASENGHRPAIDVLFRTAARTYGTNAVGVVLTGNLDDGTAGLAAIKKCGGVAIVQDPRDADYPSMPESAIANVQVDHVLPLAEIGPALDGLLRQPRPAAVICGENEVEKEPDEMGVSPGNEDGSGSASGEASGLTCPECGGTLWEKPGERPLHFRCRTGHAYSPESLLAKQTDALDEAFWAALRSLEENAALSRRMAKRAREHGNLAAGARYEQRVVEADRHAAVLRSLLQDGVMALEEAGGG